MKRVATIAAAITVVLLGSACDPQDEVRQRVESVVEAVVETDCNGATCTTDDTTPPGPPDTALVNGDTGTTSPACENGGCATPTTSLEPPPNPRVDGPVARHEVPGPERLDDASRVDGDAAQTTGRVDG